MEDLGSRPLTEYLADARRFQAARRQGSIHAVAALLRDQIENKAVRTVCTPSSENVMASTSREATLGGERQRWNPFTAEVIPVDESLAIKERAKYHNAEVRKLCLIV